MKKSIDPQDVYWSYRIENFPADINDEKLSFELVLNGLDGWELVSTREYQDQVDVPGIYARFPHIPDQVTKTFVKYIFKKLQVPTNYNNE